MPKISGPGRTKNSSKILRGRNLFILLLILALIGGLVYLGMRYTEARNDVKRLSNPAEAAKQETTELIAKVGRLTDLPKDEPTIATVKDVTKLRNQAFFKTAQNGDKVLIYTQAKKAILYRPSTNKVIEIAPVNLGDQAKSAATNTQSSTTPATDSATPAE